MPTILVRKLDPEAFIPKTWSDRAVGFDLHAFIISDTGRPGNAIIAPFKTRNIPTRIAIECPRGLYAEVRSRSGLAKHSVFVANAPGTIDPDYRGELMVLLYNGSQDPYYIRHGERIAQLVLSTVIAETHGDVYWKEVERLSPTTRGEQGFGSTGQ